MVFTTSGPSLQMESLTSDVSDSICNESPVMEVHCTNSAPALAFIINGVIDISNGTPLY